ncbi:MAG TPA: alpha/beta fold hydrolase [Burkholderiales bacterium]|nr:alpha/beta fold hydrolase [Burkholderiales bacterium]
MRPQVVLVHGLWNPSPVLWPLAARLEAAGYAARVFSYPGRREHEANVEALARFAPGGGAFVGHSLGGLVVLDMLNRHPEIEARGVVLLGAPVRGCLAGRRFRSRRLGRWMMGACCPLWEERPARWSRAAPLGVIAGTLPFGLGRVIGGALPGENDGVVCVEETTVEGMSERTLVRQGHSMLVCAPSVARLVEGFLRAGRFA